MTPALEFWFDFGSNYSYLAAMRIDQLARESAVAVRWRPFLLGPIFNQLGWSTSPFVLQKQKGAYVWRDMERLAQKYRLPWRKPSNFPRAAVHPLRIAAAHQDQQWVPAFCKSIFLLNWAHDREINDNDTCARVLDDLGLNGARLVQEAQLAGNKEKLRVQSEEAQRRGIFGAPTFFAGAEMFWGNDRLDDALAFAAAASSPRPAERTPCR